MIGIKNLNFIVAAGVALEGLIQSMLYSHHLCYPSNLLSKATAELIDPIAEVLDFQQTLGEMIISLFNAFVQTSIASTKG